MSKRSKRLILIAAPVLILSFAVSGGLSFLLFPNKPPPAASDPTGGSDAKDSMRLSGTPDRPATPSDQQMDDTIRELRLRLAECDRRDRELERRQRRLDIAAENLKAEAQELENLRLQLVAPLARLKEARAALEQTRVRIAVEEQANLKRTAAVYEKMDSAASSRILIEMCQNKQDSDAARILYYMSDRSAAKCLAEIPDRAVAVRLSDYLKRIKEEG